MKQTPVEYRIVPGYSNYRVGSDGTVWSRFNNRYVSDQWRELKCSIGKRGYKFVKITSDAGRRRDRTVHSLVLEAFVGPAPPKQEGRHLDDDKLNNCLGNLEWGTRKQNAADLQRNGRSQHGNNHSARVMDEGMVCEMRRLARSGVPVGQIAKQFGLKLYAVQAAVRGRSWPDSPEPPVPFSKRKRLTDADVLEMLRMRREGIPTNKIAKTFGCTTHIAYCAVTGRSFAHLQESA